jgi:hypothetical protein
MAMLYENIDFVKISKALYSSIEAITQENTYSDSALEQLHAAKEELEQALSFSLTSLQK